MTLTDQPPPHGAAAMWSRRPARAYNDLRKSERKVADILLADPRRILSATLAQAADLAQVSQPTVIRFCVAIGCLGLPGVQAAPSA